ncbi:MAG: hypothetical protein J5647_08165 [Spirochaetaceae bacterium]|nr:hypothetical protein [Spirochaetaceae bacterium]
MRYNKIFNANLKSFVIFSAVCFFAQFSFADDLCSQCKIREWNAEQQRYVVVGEETVCSCQSYCEISDNANPDLIQSTAKYDETCKSSYGGAMSYPEFEPNWTVASDRGVGFKGRQYRDFNLEAGMTYRWTTYDELEDATNVVPYYQSCTTDDDCIPTESKMKCYGGYCTWPFDTELTLIDTSAMGTNCSSGKVIAFSRSGGYGNQSAIEYKAPRDMKVTLLITNQKYLNGKYVSCQDSKLDGSDLLTTVKWQRYVPQYCSTCGNSVDYAFNEGNHTANPTQAPDWSEIQEYDYIDLPNYETPTATENWLKPGSYVDFDVEEGKIYRWATCKSVFFDTQLTLFKPDGDEGCGKFLAFDDDSETSYLPKNLWDQAGNDYCPAGTKQSVIEWHANFTGTVRLLFNEYNCSQCARNNNSALHWSHCFSVTEDYAFEMVEDEEGNLNVQTDAFGNPVIKKDAKGFPVVADSNTPSTEKETLTYLYSFPLDWQRYDCEDCKDSAAGYVADYCGYAKYNSSCVEDVCDSFGSYTPFCTESDGVVTCGDEVALQSGKYMTFALRRGSKYLFETPERDDVVITVKAGTDCKKGRTLVQGRGRVAYFAETSADCQDSDEEETFDPNYYSDVVTVLVSEPECDNKDTNIKNINLKYSFYTDSVIKVDDVNNAVDVKNRFQPSTIDGKTYYEDTATGVRFIEVGGAQGFAGTWEEAMANCQNLTLGGGSGAFECPKPVCPPVSEEFSYTYTPNEGDTCSVQNDDCAAPTCPANYEPYVQTIDGNPTCDFSAYLNYENHPEWCGLCISKATSCNVQQYAGWSGSACSTGNTCVTKENNQICRNKVGVLWECPSEEYEKVSDDSPYCYKEEGSYDMYYDPEDDEVLYDNNSYGKQSQGSNGTSCPEGMYFDDGDCVADGCGRYAKLTEVTCKGGIEYGWVNDPNKCYKDDGLTQRAPCCCGPIKVYKEILGITEPVLATTCKDRVVMGSKNGFVACAATIPCAAGWTYINVNAGSRCHKCDDYGNIAYANNYGDVRCRPDCGNNYDTDEQGYQTCVSCGEGSSLVKVGDEWKCLSCNEGDVLADVNEGGVTVKKCRKACPSDGYYANPDTGKCYPTIAKRYRCDTEGEIDPNKIWVQKGAYCRMVHQQEINKYPSCGEGNLVPVDTLHDCHNSASDFRPDPINCMCKTDNCAIGSVDKICLEKACRVNGTAYLDQPDLGDDNPCKDQTLYDVHQETLDGSILCSFTDLTTNDTCGKPSKGWTLPDINLLYSMVDFDLYDPVTAFPFRTGTYNRLEKKCYSNSDCGGSSPSCDMATHKCKCSQDTDCSADGTKYICVHERCERNNWFWSNTTVLDASSSKDGKFAWAVNMEDGRSYRVLKGCYRKAGEPENKCDSYALLGLKATKYQVMCVKGSTLAALFHSDLPRTKQIFSGWACDKEKSENILDIYFEIVDSKNKDLSTLVGSSSVFVDIPGAGRKGIKYGSTDAYIEDSNSDDYWKIKQNCNGVIDKPYIFKLDLNNPGTKADVVTAIKSIQGYGEPPYYVTAYAVDTTVDSATIVQPAKEVFVLENDCGDEFMTFDGNEANRENCEKVDWTKECKYNPIWSSDPSHQCQICDHETCRWTNKAIPGCGDSILQNSYCVKSSNPTEECDNSGDENCIVSQGNAVYATGHTSCQYYDFAGHGFGQHWTEECDCGNATSGVYLLTKNNDGTFSCSSALDNAVCPDSQYYKPGDADENCYICNGCAVNSRKKPKCGDGRCQGAFDATYCAEGIGVGGDEECDDGNFDERDDCLSTCKKATCGDGKLREHPNNLEDKEVCDAGSLNGTYEGGCSLDCKTVYTCGDKKIQREDCSGYSNCEEITGGNEECDEGENNGKPVTYQRFIDSLDSEWKEKCAANLHGVYYPVSALQSNFTDCLAKYKAFVENHRCSDTCTKEDGGYCGNGKLDEGESCDDGYDYDTTESKYNGKGGKGGCSLDCQFQYGCGTTEYAGVDSNGIIDSKECHDDMLSITCDNDTPSNTIGLEYSGEEINGAKKYNSEKNIILFVDMGPGGDELCDAGGSNGTYGICNSTCNGKPYCGDKKYAPNDESCDAQSENNLNIPQNQTIENAWTAEEYGSCIGVFKKDGINNVCTDSKENWFVNGNRIPCCEYGRFCGDGIIDNSVDGIVGNIVVDGESKITKAGDWRNSDARWHVQTGSSMYVSVDPINLGVNFAITSDDGEFQDVELDINVPIVKGQRYFVEYDVKVQKFESTEPAIMRAGAKMYDEDGEAIQTCSEPSCLATNPLFFVDDGTTPLTNNTWVNKKNSTPIVTVDGVSTSNSNWKEGTDSIRIYFQFKGAMSTSFLVRGLKVYTLESGKGKVQGIGADEMCDNGNDNMDVEAAKADDSYMSGCTKHVKAQGDIPGQTGCRWTNYCGDGKKYSSEHGFNELCDNGVNETNVYNGCEPGCTEIGPRCGDARLDVQSANACPFRKDDPRCESFEPSYFGEECPYDKIVDLDRCNLVSQSYDKNAYDNETGKFLGESVTFRSEQCDFGDADNTNAPLETSIKEENLDINNYGGCRTDCMRPRCGDGILDYVVRADSNGNPKTKIDENGNTVPDYVEECDCGIVAADTVEDAKGLLLNGDNSGNSNLAYAALNQKTSEGVYLCKDDKGNYYKNDNFHTVPTGASKSVFCRANCTISRCGDGIKDFGEECDDGNNDDHDDCTNNCQHKSTCGDGIYSFKRSYLCEELLDLPLESTDPAVPTMKSMRDRGVVNCCDANDTDCHADGTPYCSTLVDDLESSTDNPYGAADSRFDGKRPLHYWFDRKVMHCCFNKKYETGTDSDDDGNCINNDHVFDSDGIKTLKDFVKNTCEQYQKSFTDLWEYCDNVSYSERCEQCNPESTCGCSNNDTSCLNHCDPCGCVAYCEYKNPDVAKTCKNSYPNDSDGYITCIKSSLTTCISVCEERNSYCDNATCWNRNGACGDGVVSHNEKCDNLPLEDETGSYNDFDNQSVTTSAVAGRGGKYCTGKCRGDGCSPESYMCDATHTDKCWESGCSTSIHVNNGSEMSKCGDGATDTFAGELCDSGAANGTYGNCKSGCNGPMPKCGDGNLDSGVPAGNGNFVTEVCDKGAANGKYALNLEDSCNSNCKGKGGGGYCGDGTIQNVTYADCTCTGEICTDSEGLTCKTGVTGAAEVCDPGDTRTKNLTDTSLVELSTICADCARVGSCGDGNRNPRFEGCDCANNGNGSGSCSVDYGDGTVDFTCFSGCKANPVGKVKVVSPVKISGWACDPDHPMEHPTDLVRIEFYNKSNQIKKTAYKKTTEDVSNSVVQACGGGSNHGWKYDPSVEGTGITSFATENPIKVKVFVKSIDKAAQGNASSEAEWVQIGESTLTMGQQCGDGIVTKCADIHIERKSGSGGIQNGEACLDEDGTCASGNTCIEVKGTCAEYGLLSNVACIDEKCDEGDANGPTNPCSSGKDSGGNTYSVGACDYNYCGDGIAQTGGNGKAFSDSIGYNETGYSAASNPKAFIEECEGPLSSTECKRLFNTKCTDDENTPFAGCIPSDANVGGNTSCNSGECKWKREYDCLISHECPALSTVTGMGWTWTDGTSDAISYVHDNPVYTRTWSGSAWTPAAPESLKNKAVSDLTGPDEACKYKCYNQDGERQGWGIYAKLEWKNNKCTPKAADVPCALCDDDNGGVMVDGTWKSCKTENWKKFYQTISVNADGTVNVTAVNAPAYNSGNCSYQCRNDATVQSTHVNGKCMENTKQPECEGLLEGETWVKVTDKSNGTYELVNVTTATAPTIDQTLIQEGSEAGTYTPSTAKVFAKKENIVSGTTVDTNKCYFRCKPNYSWTGSVCKEITNNVCGDGIVRSPNCTDIDDNTGKGKVNLSWKASDGSTVTETADCYYEPDPAFEEKCDDGSTLNGQYGSKTIGDKKVSRCKSDCTGRIHDSDNKFFCGDGVIQVKSGDCPTGASCSEVTGNGSDQYPGPGFSGTFSTSEVCDPAESFTDTAAQRVALCNRSLGLSRNSYYEPDDEPSCNSSCSIQDAEKGVNCRYCGDGVLTNGETCGEGSDNNIYNGSNKGRCEAAFDAANNTTYSINIPGVYCFTVKGGDGNKGDADNACSGATVSGCYKLLKGDVVTFRVGSVGETRPSDGSSVCAGTYSGGGGGGASWVYLTRNSSNVLLLVAGGGGGGGWYNNSDTPYYTCGGGSDSTAANNNANNTGDNCGDDSASDGSAVTASNFANSSTTGAGGDGGFHWTSKCDGKKCDDKYACGGGGGGYGSGGAKGTKQYGGGGGGSYVNESTTYYSSGSKSITAGTTTGVTPSDGSITVKKPTSNATCSSCKWSTSYTNCN